MSDLKPKESFPTSRDWENTVSLISEKTWEVLSHIFNIFKNYTTGVVNALKFHQELKKVLQENVQKIEQEPGLFFRILFWELLPSYIEKNFWVKTKAIGYFEETEDWSLIKFSKAPEGWPKKQSEKWQKENECQDVGRCWCEYNPDSNENIFKFKWGEWCIIARLEGDDLHNVKRAWSFFKLVLIWEALLIVKMWIKALKKEVNKLRKDSTTGLLRREAWERAVYGNIELLSRGSLVFLDLNNFKQINDKLEHYTGDEVLRMLWNAITEAFRSQNDIAGRWGGDEFIIAIEYDKINPDEIINRIGEKMEQQIQNSELEDSVKSQILYRLCNGNLGQDDAQSTDDCGYNFVAVWVVNGDQINQELRDNLEWEDFKGILKNLIKYLSEKMKDHKNDQKDNGQLLKDGAD